MEQLKPCPFCGGEAFAFMGTEALVWRQMEEEMMIECKNTQCLIRPRTPWTSKEKAIEAWNRRAE